MKSMMVMAAAVALASPAALQAQTAEQTLDRAVAAWSKVNTVRATFTQQLTNPLTGSTTTAQGEVQQRKPGHLSIRFTQPAGDRIVADGRHVWIYLPSSNPGQVIKMRADAGMTPDVTAQFLDQPKSRYNVAAAGTGRVGERAARILTLTPRDRSVPFQRATIWVDDADGLVRQFETVDAAGMTRRITIERITVNGALDRNVFTFTPPRGVRVFDQGVAGL